MFHIDPATEEDIPEILEIEREAFSPPWTHEALSSELCRDDSFFAVARGAADRNQYFVETRNSGGRAPQPVLGFVILRRTADDGELLQIAVEKNARRRKVADALMEAALGFAGGCKRGSVFLEVRKSNVAAARLYEKHGFTPTRCRKDYYSDPIEDAVVMIREFVL